MKATTAGFWDLRGGFLVEVIGCTPDMSGRCKDGTVIILEDLQPSGDIGCVFFPRLLVQFEIGT